MSKVTLYNILEEHRLLLQKIEELDGEVTPELDEAMNLTKDQFEEKASSYGYMVKHFEDDSAAIDKEIKRLQALQKTADPRAEWFRFKITEGMIAFGFEEVSRNNLRLFFRKSKSVEISDEALIPKEYKTCVPEKWNPDKKAIKDAIDKLDINVPGASVVEKKNLQIK
jgi:hypothetical protein